MAYQNLNFLYHIILIPNIQAIYIFFKINLSNHGNYPLLDLNLMPNRILEWPPLIILNLLKY